MKKIIITGASSGIGKSLYDIYKKRVGTQGQVIGISKGGPDIEIDLTNHSKFVRICTGLKPVDLLINCAGIMPLDESGLEDQIFDVNFWAAYYLIKNLLTPNMVVVNIASISGLLPDPDLPIYAASKAALLSLTGSLAKKYAGEGIRINSISPGFFKTNLVPGGTPQELIDTIPMKREGQPDEIFDLVWLIERCKYMTGINITIDGGLLCKTM